VCGLKCPEAIKERIYQNYSVQMILIEDVNERAVFHLYAAMELKDHK
jgi:hypothetical protein